MLSRDIFMGVIDRVLLFGKGVRGDFKIKLFLAFYIVLAVLIFSSSAAADCQWINAVGEAFEQNLTPDEMKQLAINRARLSAIEGRTGVKINGGSFVKDYKLMADIVQTLTEGYITDEKIEAWELESSQKTKESFPLVSYRVRLKACVAGAGEKDPYFKITAHLNKEVFSRGEEAKIKIKATRDCYINIFNLTADDRIKIIAPMDRLPMSPLKENEEFVFPPEGFGLQMDIAPEKKRATECLIIVATRQPFDFAALLGKKEDITIPEFYRAIVSIPSQEKAEEMMLYEVASRR
ncbi:MAG: DUF4384 domain-containing protein [Nitrospirae bacterium]|nr:DUF4384 domain-containing protein [Nitrospirota bacterium]